MDRQKIFTDGVLGILAQNALSKVPPVDRGEMESDVVCRYRYNGNKCALGHSIPNDQYDPKMEGSRPQLKLGTDISERLAQILGAETQEDINFLIRFQETHDNAISVESFMINAARFGRQNGLELPHALLDR
jgi:hypothetical protein